MEPKTSKTELIPTLDRLEEKNPNGPGNKRPLSHALYKKNDIFLHFMAELKIFHAFNSVDKTFPLAQHRRFSGNIPHLPTFFPLVRRITFTLLPD